MLKAPSFWFKKNTLIEQLLWPLSFVYQTCHRMRWFFSKPHSPHTPIICVGNTGVGGAGKTPVALAIGKLLQEMNIPYKYLSRGYGGKEAGPLVVRPSYHNAQQVGDEPLLLSQDQTTIMAKDRRKGLALIKPDTTQALIMDDGYQNPSLQKKVQILVIDGKRGFGECAMPDGLFKPPGSKHVFCWRESKF